MKIFIKNRKGISGVVAAVLMIALVMVVAVIVWVVVRNIVQGQIGSVESCFGVYDKVTINNRYTCYEDFGINAFRFAIDVKDIVIDKLVVSVSYPLGETRSYTLTKNDSSVDGVYPYPEGSGAVKLPGKNSGKTYMVDTGMGKPDSIQIAPVINGQQCEISDSLFEIEDCIP